MFRFARPVLIAYFTACSMVAAPSPMTVTLRKPARTNAHINVCASCAFAQIFIDPATGAHYLEGAASSRVPIADIDKPEAIGDDLTNGSMFDYFADFLKPRANVIWNAP
ncbi:hypothetical protein [Variovorax brevis]|uniref:hypothetical protein n=1 Tax=Variovorax brevis TaxID=3053503 RepID=UPI002574DE96|nr:hypothetical protein [Variovorax sp. J22R133]